MIPTPASTWPMSVVGTRTCPIPRRILARGHGHEVGADAATEGKEAGVPVELVLLGGPANPEHALHRLRGLGAVEHEPPRARLAELGEEPAEPCAVEGFHSGRGTDEELAPCYQLAQRVDVGRGRIQVGHEPDREGSGPVGRERELFGTWCLR